MEKFTCKRRIGFGVRGIKEEMDFEWVGWAGENVPIEEQSEVESSLMTSFRFRPVFLKESQIDHFYNGFCNSVLWPSFTIFQTPSISHFPTGMNTDG